MTKLMMTSKQKKQILRVVEDKLDKLQLSRDAAQAVLGGGHKLQGKFGEVIVELSNPILKLISGDERIVIDTVDGLETLPNANDVFAYIDSDFVSWGADEQGPATKETPAAVYEIAKNATFAQMFESLGSDLNKLCFTQSQIKNFAKKHRNWLRTEGYGTFFLFKSKNSFFVAGVSVGSGGTL